MAKLLYNGKGIETETGRTVLEVLRENGAGPEAPCGGRGRCGKCRVRTDGAFSPVTESEAALLTPEDLSAGIRLACCCRVEGDGTVECMGEKASQIVTGFDESQFKTEHSWGSGVGMAADIGTTTVAVYCYDLEAGKCLSAASEMNRQREFGADVISRIEACGKAPDALCRQQALIAEQLNRLMGEYAGRARAAVIAGNTTMLHLLAGLDPSGMAQSPFIPQSLFGVECSGEQLGLRVNGPVYLSPCVSAYVGGDITAGMTACGLDRPGPPRLYVDVGTNGEMALAANGTIWCCSAAAGPAFEGAHIRCGCGSTPGAVSRVWLEPDGSLGFATIGGGKPRGICGSGLIDLTAALLAGGRMDETGRLETAEIFLADGVFLTQQDVREMQLAKAAIAAGIDTLLHDSGVSLSQVEEAYIAGGFGAHIHPGPAAEIGLLPAPLLGRFKTVGNGAGLGACGALLSDSLRERLERVSDSCRYRELSGNAFFNDAFINRMCFKPVEE